jgi:hypothetical protein
MDSKDLLKELNEITKRYVTHLTPLENSILKDCYLSILNINNNEE